MRLTPEQKEEYLRYVEIKLTNIIRVIGITELNKIINNLTKKLCQHTENN